MHLVTRIAVPKRADETTLQAGKAMTLGSSSSHGMSMEAVASARGFELLTRCVYVPPLMQPSVTEAEPCFCSSTDSSEVACHDTECINYATYVECPLDRCPTGRGCRNQRLQRPDLFPHLEPFQTEFKGYGVRTTERVRALDPVGEYVGEIIGQKELLRRTNGLGRMETNFYYIQMSNGVYIDARHRGGFTRFVNHSCNPNCKAEKWTVGGETRLLVFALRELAPGDEITFDYQWTLLGRQRIKCFCGESVCKGFIGGDVEKNPTDTPDGVFQDPTDADTVDEYLVGRTLRLFNPSSGDGSHSFSIVLVKSYDPNTREHTVVDAPPSMDQTSTSPPSTQRRRRRPTNRFDKDDSSSDGCSSNSSSDDDTISHRSGGRDAVDGTTMRQVSLSTLQWQLYIDLRGLSADDVQKAVFSIPKLNRPPRRPHLANATPLSAPASPLYLTPPRPSTPLSSSAAPRPPTFKLLLKGLSPEVNATMLRRLLGSHANTVVAIDLFFLDTSNFGHIGWALLELSDPIVFEKMRSRFDNKPFVGNTVVRSFRATDQGISSFYRVKETTIRRKHLVSTTDPKGTSSRPSSATGTRPPPPPPPSLPNSSRQPPRRPGDGSSPTTNDHTSNPSMSIASEMYCIGRKLNWVVDSSSLRPLVSPSRKAGMSASVEAMLQSKCTKIMLNVVKMLKFNREDASTAIVLFHRYVSVHPMNVSTVEWMAATCLHVVLKSHSRSLDWPAFVTAVYAAKYHGGGSSSAAQPSADELERVEHHVLSMEAALLDGLRYDISSTDPFAMLDACFRGGNLDDDNRAHKFGKRLVSDSLTATSLWTHFPVECLVVAVLYIASAAAVSANPDMPPPPPYLPRLPRSHRHTFDAAVAPLLTLFEATRCTDLPRSVLEERIRHFVDTQDAKDMPAIYFEPSNWPSAYLAWQSSHQAVQLTATHMENVAAIRRRAFVARIKAAGVPWPDLAGRPVYLQPWPYKQPHHATRGMPEACLRELSTLVNVHARDTALFVTLIGIVFPTQPQRVDDLLVLPSPSKPNNNAIDMFTDLFPGETADRTMPPISTAKRPVVKASTKSKLLQDDMHYLVFERPLHMLSTLLESTSDASIMSFATRKRIVFNLFRSVAVCHEHNIVHRFISPSNMFVYDHQVKLGGFSCARHVDMKGARTSGYALSASEVHEHMSGSALHTTAPEILLGDKVYTKRSDVWSLGVVGLHILLHGAPLIVGKDAPKQLEYLYRICGSPRDDVWPDAMHLPQFVRPKHNYHTRLRKVILERMPAFPDAAIELFENLLALDPKRRWPVRRALTAPWFADQLLDENGGTMDFSIIPSTVEMIGASSAPKQDKSAKKRKQRHDAPPTRPHRSRRPSRERPSS